MGLTLHPAYPLVVIDSFASSFGQERHLRLDVYSCCSDIIVAIVFLVLIGPSRIEGLFIR